MVRTPITEPASVLIPPVSPAARPEQQPPSVDSVQTLDSSSSFATAIASSSYVDDVRYYRNCSYETQASVATLLGLPDWNPTKQAFNVWKTVLYVLQTTQTKARFSKNVIKLHELFISIFSIHWIFCNCGQKPSLETTDTNDREPQRPSKDNSDSHSVSSHRSHRSRRSHWSVLSTFSRKKSQMDRMTNEQQQASGLALKENVKMSNPNIKKDYRGKIHIYSS